LFIYIPAFSIDNTVFTIKINGILDNNISYNGQDTIVINWQIVDVKENFTLGNAQGLRLTYDNTILQIMNWDGTDVISDNVIGFEFNEFPLIGHVGVYSNAIRVSIAKNLSHEQGYLNISIGNAKESYSCVQGANLLLAQVRFAFRSGKSVSDLSEISIRCMSINELFATAQSSAILINTVDKDFTSFEYLKHENGIALNIDNLRAPIIDYPYGNYVNIYTPNDSITTTNQLQPKPANRPDPNNQINSMETGIITNPTKPDSQTSTNYSNPKTTTEPINKNIYVNHSSPLTYNNPYKDVAPDEWFYDAVRYVTENELMKGTGNNNFSPNDSMTRAMFATVLYRLTGMPAISKKNIFIDVEDKQWYTDAIQWASENAIVLGYGGGLFGTYDEIDREQIITILYRYSMMMKNNITGQADLSNYIDASSISKWALIAMRWAVHDRIITGRSPIYLVPQGRITRAEVAQILLNYS